MNTTAQLLWGLVNQYSSLQLKSHIDRLPQPSSDSSEVELMLTGFDQVNYMHTVVQSLRHVTSSNQATQYNEDVGVG